MANIDPAPSWADIRRLETTDRNMAGPGGILNDPTTSIAARLNLLRDNDTAIGSSIAAVNARQDAADSAIANIEGQVLNAPGTLSDLENGAALDPDAAFPDVPSVENSLGPVGAFNEPINALTSRSKMLRDGLTDKADKSAVNYGFAQAELKIDDALTQVVVTDTSVAQVLHNATNDPVSNRAVYSAAEAVAGVQVNAYRFWMSNVPLLGDITLEVYSRVQAGSTSVYPPTANDTLLASTTVNGQALAMTNDWQYVEFRLPHTVTATGTDLLVWKLSAAGGLSIGIRNDATGITQFRRGWFGNAGGASQLIGSPNRLAYEAYRHEVKSVIEPRITPLELQAITETRSFNSAFSTEASHSPNGFRYRQSDGHYAWTFGAQAGAGQDIAAGKSIDAVLLNVELSSTTASIRLRVWSRPTSTDTVGVYPTNDATATLLYNGSKTLAELGLTATPGVWQALLFNFPVIKAVDGFTYIFEVWSFTAASANVGIGIERTVDNGYNQQQRGWFRGGSSLGVGSALSWSLGGQAYQSFSNKAPSDHLLSTYDIDVKANGLEVMVVGSAATNGRRVAINSLVTATAAASGTETTNNYSLTYSTATVFTSIPSAWIGRRNLSNVSAVRSDTSAPLALGSDFAFHVDGKLRGLNNVAAFNVNATYAYKRERYDVVQLNPQSMAITIKMGVERDFDAIEYRAQPDVGNVSVAYLHIVGSTVNPINASEFLGSVVRETAHSDWQRLILRNRQCTRRLQGKIARGEPITVAAYGDSIVAIQTGTVDYTANGPNRDRPETYLTYVPSDTVAALPKYDFGDGAGAVHVKISVPWKLVAALEETTGASVNYLNFGIGGTNSSDTVNNGLYPDRLAPMLASGADLLLIHFGMNELGQTATLERVRSIALQARAAGMDVAILSAPRRNGVDGETITGWEYTNTALEQAAISSGSAFVPQHWIGRDDQLGGIEAAINSLAMANLINHPGPSEFDRYGQVLVQALLS